MVPFPLRALGRRAYNVWMSRRGLFCLFSDRTRSTQPSSSSTNPKDGYNSSFPGLIMDVQDRIRWSWVILLNEIRSAVALGKRTSGSYGDQDQSGSQSKHPHLHPRDSSRLGHSHMSQFQYSAFSPLAGTEVGTPGVPA